MTARDQAIEAIAAALTKDKSLWGKRDARTALRVLHENPEILRELAATSAPSGGQHQFHLSVSVQGGGCNWVSEPYRLTVQASSINEACVKAAGVGLADWTHPEEAEVRQ